MDRKTIIVVVVCFVLMFFGSTVINKLYPPKPLPPEQANVVTTPTTNRPAQLSTAPPVAPRAPAATLPKPTAPYSGEEQTLVVTNADARYLFTSQGGGLKTIELVHYEESVAGHSKKSTEPKDLAMLNTPHAAPVLTVFGDGSVQDETQFALSRTTNGVRAEKTLTNGLRLVKDFRIGSNYLVHATMRFENTASQPLILSAQEWVVGTATPMGPDDKGDVEGVLWYNGAKTEEKVRSWFENKGFLFWGGVPYPEVRAGQSNVVWAAAHNQFFALVAMPATPALQLVSRPIDLPRPHEGQTSFTNNPAPKGFQTALVYPEVTLPAGQSLEREINFYAGPKEYRTLSRIAAQFNNNVDLIMGFGGFFGFFSKVLLLAMNWLHHTLLIPYGWAIIVITVIMKVVFWPITRAQTRTSRRMSALQPEMKALQAKYKDEPLKMQKKMSEFWKEHKINPMSGCLPMLLQMPIFFGFFFMIRTAIELRGVSFLWVKDLAKPDTLAIIPGLNFIPFISTPEGLPINLLPIFMGITMLWQARLTPASPGMDPAQAKMMKYLPAIFILFLYNYSAGLALYWTVQNLLSVMQTKLTKIDAPAGRATPGQTATILTPASKKKK